MVGPQNLKPRAASSFDMARDIAVSAGIWRMVFSDSPSARRRGNPTITSEAGTLCHDVEPSARREHRALDLGAVAHDAGILHQPFDFFRRVACDFIRREIVKGAAKILALAQDGDPNNPA